MNLVDKKKKILVLVLVILLLLTLGISYAYFSYSGKQSEFLSFRAGNCLSITITEESDAISLNHAVPETVEDGLKSTPYTFKIKNNCPKNAPYQISLESLNESTNTLGVDYVHLSLEDSEGKRITDKLGNFKTTDRTLDNSYDARKLLNGELEANGEKEYSLRLWLDYDATKEQAANKTYLSKIVISARDNIQTDEDIIKLTYGEESSEAGLNGWYKNYTTRVSITDSKDTNLKAKYCIGSDICAPNTDIEVTNNTITYNYPNGSNYLCTKVEDSLGNSSKTVCNSLIKVDNEKPRIEIISNTSTENSITINVRGTDNYSEIQTYYYKIEENEYSEENITTKTFNSLTSDTTYTVSVYAKDKAGNESEVVSKEIKTDLLLGGDKILANNSSKGSKISFTGIATEEDTGVYEAPDDYGTSYYFRGVENQLNNWAKFAGFYWRIIRINGNGTIRMIYSGVANGNISSSNKTGVTTQIGTSMYNHTANDNAYVGYMMGIPLNGTNSTTATTTSNNSTSYEQAHTNTYESDAKKTVDSWYKINIEDKGLSKYIDVKTGFCNDRELSKGTYGYNGNGYSTQSSAYAPAGRLYGTNSWKTTQTPTLRCNNKSRDLFTVNNTNTENIGNKKLTYPVGLITSDEVVFAGGFGGKANSTYYLYTNQLYWTMSPYWAMNAGVFRVHSDGHLEGDYYRVTNTLGLRPVLNLRADTKFTGNGIETDPYVVV